MKSCNADMHAGKSAATKSGNNLKYHSALVSLLSGGGGDLYVQRLSS